jgi:hypothetical protein
MFDEIVQYAKDRGYEWDVYGEDCTVVVHARQRLRIEVTVHEWSAREWFVRVIDADTEKEVVSEYYFHRSKPMIDAVIEFLDIVASADLRVAERNGVTLFGRGFFKLSVLEIYKEEEWKDIVEVLGLM